MATWPPLKPCAGAATASPCNDAGVTPMNFGAQSIRTRLMVGAAVVLLAFMAVAGVALQRAHADGVRAAHYARLQSTVYLLLAGAELDAAGSLIMPTEFAKPRLSLPASGL